jgi:hypothetical protein
MGEDHQQVEVTVLVRLAPGLGTKQDDLLGLKLVYQTMGNLLQQRCRYPGHRISRVVFKQK